MGAAVTAMLILKGVHPALTLVLSFAAGLLAGCITGLIHVCLLYTSAEQKAEEENAEAAKHEPRKAYGFIAVSVGDGLGEIFKGIGADYLIEGGQTMNPSTEDMVCLLYTSGGSDHGPGPGG